MRALAAAFLRRTMPLLGILAIIAGIFGMHVMTGSHGMPPAAAAAEMATVAQEAPCPVAVRHAVAPQEVPSPRTGHSTARSTPAPGMDSTPAPSCGSAGSCTAMSAMEAVCVPAPGNPTLVAPLPDNTPLLWQGLAGPAAPRTGYNYLPGSPSPGELCISRT